MCNRSLLDSSREDIESIALLELFRITRITLHCPFHESSSVIFTEWVVGINLLQIGLKRLSMRVTLDLFHEFANTQVFGLFHNCMWQSRHSEVNVYFLELCEETRWLLTNKSPFLIIGFLVFGWIRWESSPSPATSEPNSCIQLSLNEIFGGGRVTHIFSRI